MRSLLLGVSAAVVAAAGPAPAVAHADPVPVFPGMEIHQGIHRCTLGYVDPVRRIAVTAGHCRDDAPITDKDNNVIGTMATFRDNTPGGTTVNSDQAIADYESIVLAEDVMPSNILPGGPALESDPALVVNPGDPVCHFGVVTGESCGTVDSVHNGWFTMTNGVVNQKGDSGGPIYVGGDSGSARIVGIFNSTWGQFPTAVSWQSISQQLLEDGGGPT